MLKMAYIPSTTTYNTHTRSSETEITIPVDKIPTWYAKHAYQMLRQLNKLHVHSKTHANSPIRT